MEKTLILKAGKERSLLRRHPWVYVSAVAHVRGAPENGETVRVETSNGVFLAWAAYSPNSQIRARVWSFNEAEVPNEAWFLARLQAAIQARRSLAVRTNSVRLVFGEADGLPGLVIDQYGQQVVVQFLAAGVEYWRDCIVSCLSRLLGDVSIYERSDAAARLREGLEKRVGVLAGKAPAQLVQIEEDGVQYEIDVYNGHKTGFYLDQRDNRRRVAELSALCGPSARVLNCFSYTGGFSLAALKGGAKQAISVDSSKDALTLAHNNAIKNNFTAEQFLCREQKVADALRQLASDGETFDIVILDPPKFAPSSHHVDSAARAYKDINLRGMRLVKPGGYLLTFSCSGAISVELFQKIVAGAVVDSKQEFVMLERLAAGIDHPMRMTHPEGEYLKGLLLQKVC